MAETSSRLRIRSTDGIVHGLKYINDRSYTCCGCQAFPILSGGGTYCTYSSPTVTCLSCIAEGGPDD